MQLLAGVPAPATQLGPLFAFMHDHAATIPGLTAFSPYIYLQASHLIQMVLRELRAGHCSILMMDFILTFWSTHCRTSRMRWLCQRET